MARKRNPRVDRDVRSALADLLDTEISDPRIAFVTLTDVDVTPDHEVATIFYSTLDPELISRDPRRTGGDRVPDPVEVADGLSSAATTPAHVAGKRRQAAYDPGADGSGRTPSSGRPTRIDELLRDIGTDGPSTSGTHDPSVYKQRPRRMTGERTPWMADVEPAAIDAAVARIRQAVAAGERVVVAAHVSPGR
jgi:ribosome-binding factor A